MGGYKRMPGFAPGAVSSAPAKRAAQLPESVDWREKGAISPVKDQQACGSCWAFCATAMIESYAQISEGGDVPILSSQQVPRKKSTTQKKTEQKITGDCLHP